MAHLTILSSCLYEGTTWDSEMLGSVHYLPPSKVASGIQGSVIGKSLTTRSQEQCQKSSRWGKNQQ